MARKDVDKAGIGSKLRRSQGFAVYVTCLAFLTDSLIYGVIVPLLPTTLVYRGGLQRDQIQLWNSILLAVFSGATLIGSMLFGWVSSRLKNLKWTFVLGQMMLVGSTILFAFTRSIPILVIARLLQGLSNAVVWTLGYALMYDSVETHHFGKVMGYAAMSNSIGIFLGPIIGGVLYGVTAYELVFLPPTLLIVLCTILRILIIDPPRRDRKRAKKTEEYRRLLDESQHRSYSGSRTADQDGNSDTWASTPGEHQQNPLGTRLRRASSTVTRIAATPLATLLRDFRFVVALFGVFSVNGITTAFEAVLPVYVFQRFDFNPTQSALLFLCITLPMLLSPITGWIVDKFGPKPPAFIGWSIAAASLCLLRLVELPDSNQLLILIVLLIIFGFSVALVLTPMNAEVTFAVESLKTLKPELLGEEGANSLAFGIQTAAFASGCLVGPIYAGVIRQYYGWPAMALALGAIAIMMTILSFVITGGKISTISKFRKVQRAQEDSTTT